MASVTTPAGSPGPKRIQFKVTSEKTELEMLAEDPEFKRISVRRRSSVNPAAHAAVQDHEDKFQATSSNDRKTASHEKEAGSNRRTSVNGGPKIQTIPEAKEDHYNTQIQTSLTETEVKELREIFSLVDLDNGGTISKDELKSLMKKLKYEASQAEIENIVNEIDTKGTGEIDFESFVHAMSKKTQFSMSPKQLKRAFHKFTRSTNPPGTILIRDFIQALSEYGTNPITKKEAAKLVQTIAPNLGSDDFFDYNQYVNVMYSN